MPLQDTTPQVILISDETNAVGLAVSGAIPANTPGILMAGVVNNNTASFLKLDSGGNLFITGSVTSQVSVTATNPSVGLTGSAVPVSASYIAGVDGTGLLRGLSTTTAGVLNVTGSQFVFNNVATPLFVTSSTPLAVTGSLSVSVIGAGGGVRITNGTSPIDTNEGSVPVTSGALMIEGYDSTTQTARRLSVDTTGRLIIAPAGSNQTNGFKFGTVTTSATTNVPIRATTYTEPAANAQRSFSSANAADTAAGTGARQVTLTYYTATFTGPFTEVITLNGATPVNTVSTTIRFVELIVVTSVGSGGTNAGIITMFGATAGGGGTVATVAVGDISTLWAQHYVATGKTAFITGVSGHNNNASNGTVLSIRAQDLSSTTSPNTQISDYVQVGGSTTGQITRIYDTPIRIPGPARIVLYGAPNGTPNIITRASFDYYEQ